MKDNIYTLTDQYLEMLGGTVNADNIDRLNADQHTLLAYRILRDEAMEGGFIQLIQNGFGPYVLAGPFPMMIKKHWGLPEFGKFLYEVRKEYLRHREELEREMDDDAFMALYEEFDTMNNFGDDFLDDWEETVTPAINQFVEEHRDRF